MLIMKGIKKSYQKCLALDDLNITVTKGALYGFVGPNGAGKTTAIKMMAGLLKPDSGQIMLDGIDVIKNPLQLKKEIGYVPDAVGVYDNLKVSEYMDFFASCYGMNGLKARERYRILLEQVGLDDKTDLYVDTLSRGMKQRLNLARALIHDPMFLIMDEPTLGLDPRTRVELNGILTELHEQGKTILISSHVLSELSELCTDIGIIEQGKMVLGGNIKEILARVYTSNPLLISLFDAKDKAMKILKSHPDVRSLSIKGDEIRVNFQGDKEDEVMLLQQLIGAQIPVYGFFRESGSLESLFMQITNHEKSKVVVSHENQSSL